MAPAPAWPVLPGGQRQSPRAHHVSQGGTGVEQLSLTKSWDFIGVGLTNNDYLIHSDHSNVERIIYIMWIINIVTM